MTCRRLLALLATSSLPPYFVVVAIAILGCSSSKSPPAQAAIDSVTQRSVADSVWKARLRSSVCRRPSPVTTAKWPEFLTASRSVLIRIPPFLLQEPYQAAQELAKAGGHKQGPPYGTQWLGDNGTQFAVYVPKSLKLAYPGVPEPEESICIENIDGAQATVLASNRGAAKKTTPNSTAAPTASLVDSVGPMDPYTVFASMRFPDGLGLEMYGFASTADQQNQLLAAIRTIRRVRKSY